MKITMFQDKNEDQIARDKNGDGDGGVIYWG